MENNSETVFKCLPVEMDSDEVFVDSHEYLPAETSTSTSTSSVQSSSDGFPAEGSSSECFPPDTESCSGQISSESITSTSEGIRSDQINPTEKRWTGPACLRAAGKAVKQSFKTLKSKVCSAMKRSHTSRHEPAAAADPLETEPTCDEAPPSTSASVAPPSPSQERPTEQSFTFHNDVTLGDFFCRYQLTVDKVRSKIWKYPFGTLEAVRRSDGQKVVIRFIERHQCGERTVLLPEFPNNAVCEETATVIMLQKTPASEHLPRLHECYIMDQKEILVMEYIPAPFIALGLFIRSRGSNMKEKVARVIMRNIFVALNDCWERRVYLPIDLEGIAVNPITLQIRITDFSLALVKTRMRAGNEKLEYSESYFKVMDALVKNIDPPFWKRRLSRECSDLLWRLETHQGQRLMRTLQDILKDPWFV